jgi:hypothetical protein
VKITHPRDRYTGPVVTGTGRRLWFVDGEADETNLAAGERRSLADAGFQLENPRAARKASSEGSDES